MKHELCLQKLHLISLCPCPSLNLLQYLAPLTPQRDLLLGLFSLWSTKFANFDKTYVVGCEKRGRADLEGILERIVHWLVEVGHIFEAVAILILGVLDDTVKQFRSEFSILLFGSLPNVDNHGWLEGTVEEIVADLGEELAVTEKRLQVQPLCELP